MSSRTSVGTSLRAARAPARAAAHAPRNCVPFPPVFALAAAVAGAAWTMLSGCERCESNGQNDGEPSGHECNPAAAADAARPRSCALSELKITRFPLDGVNGRDWMINNYVDLDPPAPASPTTAARAARARAPTTDIRGSTSPSLRFARWTRRAVIHAATAGVVEQVIHDQPDRNTSCAGRWNVVRVRHANGFRSCTATSSAARRGRPGQAVAPGTPLAIVGSAGCSTQPHLHLEVRDCAGRALETLQHAAHLERRRRSTTPPPRDGRDVGRRRRAVGGADQRSAPDPAVIAARRHARRRPVAGGARRRRHRHDADRPDGGSSAQYLLLDDHGARASATGIRGSRWRSAARGVWTVEMRINGTLEARRAVTVSPPPEPAAAGRHRRDMLTRRRAAWPRATFGATPGAGATPARGDRQCASANVTAASNSARPSAVKFAAAVSRIAIADPARRRRQPRHRRARRVTEQHRVRGIVRHGRGDDRAGPPAAPSRARPASR